MVVNYSVQVKAAKALTCARRKPTSRAAFDSLHGSGDFVSVPVHARKPTLVVLVVPNCAQYQAWLDPAYAENRRPGGLRQS